MPPRSRGNGSSGKSYAAIDTALQAITHQSLPLRSELVAKLANWLDAYAHSYDAPRLRDLFNAIKSFR